MIYASGTFHSVVFVVFLFIKSNDLGHTNKSVRTMEITVDSRIRNKENNDQYNIKTPKHCPMPI